MWRYVLFAGLLGLGTVPAHSQQHFGSLKFQIRSPIFLHEAPGYFIRAIYRLMPIDTLLWIATQNPGELLIFDRKGNFVRRTGRSGKAPTEYTSPAYLRVYGDTVWIWDSMALKFLRFHRRTFQPLDPIAGFTRNCNDFLVLGNEYVLFSHPQRTEYFLSRFDLKRRAYVRQLGAVAYEDVILSLWGQTYHLARHGPYVYTARPSQALIYRLDLRTDSIASFPLDLPDFSVASFSGPRLKGEVTKEALRFMFTQSLNRGVWDTSLGLMVLVETGAYRIQEGKLKVGDRALHFVLIHPETLQQLGRVRFDATFMGQRRLSKLVGWDPQTATFYFHGERDEEPIHQITPVRFYLE